MKETIRSPQSRGERRMQSRATYKKKQVSLWTQHGKLLWQSVITLLIMIIQPQGETIARTGQYRPYSCIVGKKKKKEPTESKPSLGGRLLNMSFNFLVIKEKENSNQMCAVWSRPPCDAICFFFWCVCFCIGIMANSLHLAGILTGHKREMETGPRR